MLVPKLLMNKFSSCTTVAQISPVAPYHALCFIKKKKKPDLAIIVKSNGPS